MRIYVTGAAGYIGSHVAHALASEGYIVIGIDNFSLKENFSLPGKTVLHRIDISSETGKLELSELFKNGTVDDVVIHLAAKKSVAESVRNPGLYQQNNVEGTRNILIAMSKAGLKKLIFASTAAVYGNSETPIDENAPLSPQSPYAQTKLLEEALIREYVASKSIKAIVFRFFNVAGAGSPELIERTGDNIFPQILQAHANKETFKVFGDKYPTVDGTCIRDYVHVLDIARAHIQALSKFEVNNLQIINLGSGTGSSVLEVIKEFKKHFSLPYEISDPREGDFASLLTNISEASRRLSWAPIYTLEEMVKSSIS
jgi:UDP-glucose 4-epimerase